MDGSCDCIRNGEGPCIASPPSRCNSQGANTCEHELKCNTEQNLCMCPQGTSLIGKACVTHEPGPPDQPHFISIYILFYHVVCCPISKF